MPADVRLLPMTPEEYDRFVDRSVPAYARSNVEAGRWSTAESERLAREEFARILPQGRETPDQFFFQIHGPAPGKVVGRLWLALMRRTATPIAYVYDIEIDPEFRRLGFAEAALRAAEGIARAHGADRMMLNVFGTNHGAQALYEKLDYRVSALAMVKRLPT